MSGFIKGEDRNQATLFPERIDDYIPEESAVRVIVHGHPEHLATSGNEMFNATSKSLNPS